MNLVASAVVRDVPPEHNKEEYAEQSGEYSEQNEVLRPLQSEHEQGVGERDQAEKNFPYVNRPPNVRQPADDVRRAYERGHTEQEQL